MSSIKNTRNVDIFKLIAGIGRKSLPIRPKEGEVAREVAREEIIKKEEERSIIPTKASETEKKEEEGSSLPSSNNTEEANKDTEIKKKVIVLSPIVSSKKETEDEAESMKEDIQDFITKSAELLVENENEAEIDHLEMIINKSPNLMEDIDPELLEVFSNCQI
jgi:hypothetical protein